MSASPRPKITDAELVRTHDMNPQSVALLVTRTIRVGLYGGAADVPLLRNHLAAPLQILVYLNHENVLNANRIAVDGHGIAHMDYVRDAFAPDLPARLRDAVVPVLEPSRFAGRKDTRQWYIAATSCRGRQKGSNCAVLSPLTLSAGRRGDRQ